MQTLQLSETTAARRRIPVYLVDATDGFTPEVGVVTPTVEVSKNGAAQGAGAGTWVEIGEGLYYYEATAGEVNTLGFLNVRIVEAGVSREFQAVVQVVSWDPYFDFTTPLDATVSSRASAVALAAVQTDVDDIQSRLPPALVGGAMDSDVSNMQADALDADAVSAGAVTKIQAGLASQASVDAIATAIGLLNNLSSGDVDTVISANAAVVLMRKVLTNRRETNGVTGMLDIYNDADTAVEFSIPIFEDVAGAIAYRERGINRQDKIV